MTVLLAGQPVRRVLIRSLNWIGDAVMSTPAIGIIREHFPQAEIVLLANPVVAPLFQSHEWVDRVIIFDQKGTHRGLSGRLRLAAELRKQQFDAAIIFPNSFNAALVPWLARIPIRLGKVSDGRKLLLTGRYRPAHIRHEVEYYVDLLEHFGITGSRHPLTLQVTGEEERAADLLLASHGVDRDICVLGINPGASYGAAKRWYPERFAEAASRLAEQWSARPVIFGSQAEKPLADEIERLLNGKAINLAGTTTVRQLMALIRRCDFFITNDSGPMHIAAAFGVPQVAVFGSTDHATTSPWSPVAAVVRKETDCAPCKLRECPTDHRCMTSVNAEDVITAALKLRQVCPPRSV